MDWPRHVKCGSKVSESNVKFNFLKSILMVLTALCAFINSDKRQIESDPVYASLGIDSTAPFGYKYIFELEDAIDAMPESLVDFPAFER